MSMTRRDYTLLADALKYSRQQASYIDPDYSVLAVELAAKLVADALEVNKNFDRTVFLQKAGVAE